MAIDLEGQCEFCKKPRRVCCGRRACKGRQKAAEQIITKAAAEAAKNPPIEVPAKAVDLTNPFNVCPIHGIPHFGGFCPNPEIPPLPPDPLCEYCGRALRGCRGSRACEKRKERAAAITTKS